MTSYIQDFNMVGNFLSKTINKKCLFLDVCADKNNLVSGNINFLCLFSVYCTTVHFVGSIISKHIQMVNN